MSATPFENLSEIFGAPIEGVIAALGKGIADAQTELDKASAAAADEIAADPVLSQHGVQPTWYQFPRVELKLKLALTVAQDTSAARSAALATGLPLKLVAQPVTAGYQNRFNFAAQAASTVTVTLVPVPSPAGTTETTAPARMTRDEVHGAALATGRLAMTGPPRNRVVDPTLRLDVNFNPNSRLWYVLQHSAIDPSRESVLVVIDDRTGQVRA
jgi:hypothetical protein